MICQFPCSYLSEIVAYFDIWNRNLLLEYSTIKPSDMYYVLCFMNDLIFNTPWAASVNGRNSSEFDQRNAVEWKNSLSLLLYCIQIALNVVMWSCVTLSNKISDTSVGYSNYNNMAQFSKEYICTNPCSTLQHKSTLNNNFFFRDINLCKRGKIIIKIGFKMFDMKWDEIRAANIYET